MNKGRLFIDNFIIYGVGGIINKIIPLVMVPVVTRLMPNTDYFGISDLSNTVVQFGSAVAVMGMYDAMYRMFFEREGAEYKRKVCSTALMFTVCVSILVFFIMLVMKNTIAKCFLGDKKYAYVVYFSAMATLVGATNSIISAPTRMQNKRKIFLVTNTIGPLLSYSISIPMLFAGHYVIALPLAMVISGFVMELSFGIMNRKWFSPRFFEKNILKQMLVIGVPLLPNILIYWVFNSCDKIMIINMMDVGFAGIYSVSSKLGHASQLIYTAFAGGWQYYAFSTMKEDDQVKRNSLIFEYLGIISFVATCCVCVLSFWIFKVIFPASYLLGYIVAPYLFLAPLLQMLYQVIANQFLIVKKTWPNMLILSCGTILNIVINYILIPVIGIEGAAIATLIGYVVSDIVCVIVLCYMRLMIISGRFIFASILITTFIFAWRLFFSTKIFIGIICSLATTCIYVCLYRNKIKRTFLSIKREKDVFENDTE